MINPYKNYLSMQKDVPRSSTNKLKHACQNLSNFFSNFKESEK